MRPRWTALGTCLAVALVATVAQSQHPPTEWQQPPAEETDTDAQPRPAEEQGQRASQGDESAGPSPPTATAVNEPVDAESANNVTGEDRRYPNCEFDTIEECDLAAQQSMAEHTIYMDRAAWVSVLLTAVGVLLIYLTMRYTKYAAAYAKTAAEASVAMVDEARKSTNAAACTADAAVETNRIGREAFIADHRPWISVDISVSGPLTWENGCNVNLLIGMRNTGRSPACNTTVSYAACDYHVSDVFAEQRRISDRTRAGYPAFPGFTLFPEQGRAREIQVSMHRHQIESERDVRAEKGIDPSSVSLVVVGCVRYQSVFDNRPHQTGIIKLIRWKTAKGLAARIDPSVGDIPPEQLVVESEMYEGQTD